MKRRVSISFVILLCIISSIIAFAYRQKAINTQLKIDRLFRESLSGALSGFGVDYSKMDDDSKLYYYTSTSGNLKAASNLVFETTFKEKNKHLPTSISYLYLCMTRESSRTLLLEEGFKLYELISNISFKPEDIESARELEKIAGDIYFKRSR